MLTRRREQIIVLVGLTALNLGFGWLLSRYWKDYRSRTQWVVGAGLAPPSVELAAGGGPQRAPGMAQSFAEIVDRTIFRPERTNEAAGESVKMPELPVLYGTMNLGGGMFAMMAPGDQANGLSQPVRLGEEVGGYKLVSIADSQVVVAWGEKQFTVNVWESARKIPRIVERSGPTAPSAEPSGATGGPRAAAMAASRSGAPVVVGSTQEKKSFAGFHAPPGATPDAPEGTVIDGKRKVVVQTPFGPSVRWEDVGQPKESTQQNPPKEKQP